jgi:hypothetical protein
VAVNLILLNLKVICGVNLQVGYVDVCEENWNDYWVTPNYGRRLVLNYRNGVY